MTVRTLVISDLHLGAAGGKDLLRRADLRAALVEALDGIDRLVVLGDGLELREAAHRDAADIAAPFLADAGRALGREGELVVLAGNHDHGLVAGWIDARLQTEPSGFLGLAEPVDPAAAGPLAARLAELARPARVRMAYPGTWLRDDVYAIHGHYVDLHSTVPTFERLAAGAMARWVVRLPEHGARPDDYEAALAPIYAFLHQLTQRSDHAAVSAGAGASARAWVALAGDGRRAHPARAALLGTGYAGAVAALNALGLGPVDRDLSAASLRRGGLRGMREVLRRLGVQRAVRALRPHPPLRPVAGATTRRSGSPRGGTRLLNTGSWVYQPHFLSTEPNASPYWPGTAVLVEETGPPRLIAAAGGAGPPGAATPAVKHVAWHATPAPTRKSSTPAVWCGCSEQRIAPGRPRARRGRWRAPRRGPRAPPTPPPASYGPEYAPGWSAVCAGSSTPSASSGRSGASGSRSTPEQRLDLALGLGVRALAVVERVQRAVGVPQVARGPALVAVEVPDLAPLVDHHRVAGSRAGPPPRRRSPSPAREGTRRCARRSRAGRPRRSARAMPGGRAACASSRPSRTPRTRRAPVARAACPSAAARS